MVIAQAGVMTAYRHDTYFFRDDLLFFEQARQTSFGVSYLRLGLFEHFSPISRLLDYILVHAAPGNFTVAFLLMVLMFALTLCAFGAAAVSLLGNGPLALAVTAAFGQSLFQFHLLEWWTATANILPAIGLGLAALAGYVTWQRERRHRWLMVSVVAYALSLGAHEQAMLLGPELLLVRLLVLTPRLTPATALAVVWRERVAWLIYGSLTLLAAWNYYHFYYIARPRPGLRLLAHFAEVSVVETFLPGLLGVKYPEAGAFDHLATVVIVTVIVVAVVAVTVLLRRRAWRPWALLGCILGVNTLALATSRAQLYGVVPARQLWYFEGAAFFALLCLGCALSTRVSGPADPTRVAGARRRGLRPLPTRVGAAIALGVVIGYQGLFATSARALTEAAYEPRLTAAYVNTFLADYRRAEERGADVVLLNRDVPPVIQGPEFAPYQRYDRFFPFFVSDLRVDEAPGSTYLVAPDGRLLPTTLARDVSIDLTDPATRASVVVGDATASAAAAQTPLCVTPTGPHPVVVVTLPMTYVRDDIYMRIDYRTDASFTPAFAADPGDGLRSVDSGRDHWSPGMSGGYVQIQLPAVAKVAVGNFPAGSRTCIIDIVVGHPQY